MNKLELEGILYTQPRSEGDGQEQRALFCLKVEDENGHYTIFPAKAWREVADVILKMNKEDHIHCLGKITRYKPKSSDNWVTDVEITKIL